MKIIHTADIHLDAAMQGKGLSPERARVRREELREAFLRLAEYARSVGASGVIIAGDLFDRGEVTVRVRRFVLDTIKKYPEMRFFLLFGNHDSGCFSFSDELPENLTLFSDEWQSVTLGDVVIHGVELTGENFSSVYESFEADPEKLNIAVMHGAVGTSDGEDRINLKKLSGKGIDYLALGHYHSFEIGKLDRHGVYCYPGCLEGRGYDECGDKGFSVINIENGKITADFVKNSIRTVLEVNADMTGADSYFSQKEAVKKALLGVPESSLVRVRTEGALRPSEEKFFSQIERELKDRYFSFEIKDKTGLLIDRTDYEGDISLKGEFIRLVSESIEDADLRDKIISCGLSALLGGNVE